MTFEELKELFKDAIDESYCMSEAIQKLVDKIYKKGYMDGFEATKGENG